MGDDNQRVASVSTDQVMGRAASGEGERRTAVRTVARWPSGEVVDDEVVREEPLEIRVEDRAIAVTMRSPGDDLDLVAGFLLSEGIVDGADDIVAMDHLAGDPAKNVVVVRVAGGVEAHAAAIGRATRELYASSACGICGKASLDRIHLVAPRIADPWPLDVHLVTALPELLRSAQAAFGATGGAHAAALVAPDGAVEVVREDVGRHNAVDKVVGWRLRRDEVPVDDRILVVSGRIGFEVVQKARMAGIRALAGFGAGSDLAIDLARDGGMVLVGFVRPDRFVRYT